MWRRWQWLEETRYEVFFFWEGKTRYSYENKSGWPYVLVEGNNIITGKVFFFFSITRNNYAKEWIDFNGNNNDG